MKILFITSTRLGDGVLSTGILSHLIRQYPNAEVTVACGPLVAGIVKPIPGVTRVIALKKQKYNGHWFKLMRDVITTRWDIVVDLRDSIVSRLLPAKQKYIWGKQNKSNHKVQQNADVIGASPPPAPELYFDPETLEQAERFIPGGDTPVLGVGPSAQSITKTWPAENFVALIERLTADQGLIPDARIAVFAAPGEEEAGYAVLNAFPKDRQIDLIAKTTPLQAAAAIKRCQFYIGNDSGLMHCAAAVGVPTLGLFGPSWPHLYHPWGDHCYHVATPENFDELLASDAYDPKNKTTLMTTLTVDAAHKGAVELWERLSRIRSAA